MVLHSTSVYLEKVWGPRKRAIAFSWDMAVAEFYDSMVYGRYNELDNYT
jgi:hypothetical protein